MSKNSPRTVVHISGSLPPLKCGVGFYFQTLLTQLHESARDEASWHVITTASSDVDSSLSPYPVSKLPSWRLTKLARIYKQVASLNPAIVHIQYPTLGYGRGLGINLLPLSLRLFKPKTKVVVTLHEFFASPVLGKVRNIVTAAFAHKIIVSNNADYTHLPSLLRRKAVIIPIGSSIDSQHPNVKAAQKLLSDGSQFEATPYVIYYGFPFPSKRLETLLNAIQSLGTIRLVLACDLNDSDPYQKQLLDHISEINRGLPGHICLVGFQDNDTLSALIDGSLCFALTQDVPVNLKSSTALTALRRGTIIIGKKGADGENLPLENQINAVLLDHLTPESLATTIQQLSDDPHLREALKQNLRNLAAVYSWDQIVDKHFQLYKELQ